MVLSITGLGILIIFVDGIQAMVFGDVHLDLLALVLESLRVNHPTIYLLEAFTWCNQFS